jgi:hypothetical protein
MFVLAHPRLPSLPRTFFVRGAYFAKGPNRLPPGSIDPLPPQNRSPHPRGLPIPNVSTCKPSGVQTASYPHPNHIVVKSDELTIMESHSCTKHPGGRGCCYLFKPLASSLQLPAPACPACPEPRGERKRRERPLEVEGPVAASHSLATRSGPLDSYTLALLNFVSRSESTLPRHPESVSKQRTLTSLESTLTSSHTPHSKQRTLSPFRMNTYTIYPPNSFRMNTSKKQWGRGVFLGNPIREVAQRDGEGYLPARRSPRISPCSYGAPASLQPTAIYSVI